MGKNLFHERLQALLDAGTAQGSAKWTVALFAKKTGFGERTVRSWLSGERVPEQPAFDAICEALFGKAPAEDGPYAELTQLWEAAREARTPGRPAKPAPPPTTTTPIPRPDRCWGRDAELESLVATLTGGGPRTALILGDGGMGKTTLTREASHHAATTAAFGPRRFEAMLETATSAADMQAAIARALGCDPSHGLPAIRASLGSAPALLLLDNLETPWEAEAGEVEALLRALTELPGLALMASMRGAEAPRIRWYHRPTLAPLAEPQARRLFLDIAHRIAEDDPLLAPLLRELAGIPLAVTLVAWQAEVDTSLSRIWGEWQRLGAAAASDTRPGNHRQASLPRSIDLSLASPRLGEAGRRLFSILGAMPAGMAEEDARALLGEAASEAMRQLRALALAQGDKGRIDLLPPLRRHAAAAYPPQGEDASAWALHLLGVTAGFEDIMLSRGRLATERLAPEIANLEAAFRLSGGDAAIRAKGLRASWCYGMVCERIGQGGVALRALAVACAAAGDRHGEANCMRSLAQIDLQRSDHAAARDGYQKALSIHREIGDRLGEANCIQSLAQIDLERSDHAAARDGYQKALPIHRDIGDRLGEANCIQRLAQINLQRSDHAAARGGYKQALTIFRDFGNRLGEANCIQSLAQIDLQRSDHAAARDGYQLALTIHRDIGSRLGEANCIQSLADIDLERSDHAAARDGYQQALAIHRDIGDRLGEANCIQGLAQIDLQRSNHAAARDGFQLALTIHHEFGDRLGEANCIQRRAQIDLQCSDHAAARDGFKQALPVYREIGDMVGEAGCIAGLGEVAATEGDPAQARRLLDQAIALYESVCSAHNAAWARRVIRRLNL